MLHLLGEPPIPLKSVIISPIRAIRGPSARCLGYNIFSPLSFAHWAPAVTGTPAADKMLSLGTPPATDGMLDFGQLGALGAASGGVGAALEESCAEQEEGAGEEAGFRHWD